MRERKRTNMTKKHYELIAEELNAALEINRNEGRAAINATMRMIDGLSVVFKQDNPNFDRARFYAACGVRAGDGL